MLRGIATIILISSLCAAIYFSERESWQTAWFVLLFFVGLPLLLLSLRDLFALITPKWLGRGQLLLHTVQYLRLLWATE